MLSKLASTVALAGLFLSAPFALSQSNDPGGAQYKAPAAAPPTEVASADAGSAPRPKSTAGKHGKKKKAKAAPPKTS
jgi:hypothetical protein